MYYVLCIIREPIGAIPFFRAIPRMVRQVTIVGQSTASLALSWKGEKRGKGAFIFIFIILIGFLVRRRILFGFISCLKLPVSFIIVIDPLFVPY